ncbi:MAG: lytic transglycosylase domain-containing protein, partial [Oxalobacteraceae bacterium]
PILSAPSAPYSLPSRATPVAPAAEDELYVIKPTGQGRGVALPAVAPQASTQTDQPANPVSVPRAPQMAPQVDSAFVF